MGGTKTVKKTQGIQFAQQYRSVFILLAHDSRKLIYFPNAKIFLRKYYGSIFN